MIAALMLLAAAGGANVNETVKVDGKSYRVEVKKGVVKVAQKAIIAGQTVDDRRRMTAAVKQVTGCELHDPFWRNSALLGELRCGE